MPTYVHTATGERVHVPNDFANSPAGREKRRLEESDEWERVGDDYVPHVPEPPAAPAEEPAEKPEQTAPRARNGKA